jgi:hypothetical protein
MTHPDDPAPLFPRARGWILLTVVLGLLALGPPIKRVLQNYMNMALRAKLSEATPSLEWIREAQAQHHREHGSYLAAPPMTDFPARSPQEVVLPEGSPWKVLGWDQPSLRCPLEVELVTAASGEEDFLATALCDGDGDGVPARFIARSQLEPTRLTPDGVF